MINRRTFIEASAMGSAALAASGAAAAVGSAAVKLSLPCVISTWDFGVAANQAAWAILSKGRPGAGRGGGRRPRAGR